MKYFLSEIYITHKKTWFGWMEYNERLTIQLVEAKDWIEAYHKTQEWAKWRMKELKRSGQWRYKAFTTAAI